MKKRTVKKSIEQSKNVLEHRHKNDHTTLFRREKTRTLTTVASNLNREQLRKHSRTKLVK